ncbi:hypothetical protein [Oceaniglobus indicus]|uniref:hypothetical protein n=1 Tax=Oceaniglobus indicus TaxID=2047749 RepID=UPI000C1A5EBD|nr:hypothetical protein [Oceaniglobus indicus]
MVSEKIEADGARLTLHHAAPEMEPGVATMAVSGLRCPSSDAGAAVLRAAAARARSAGAQALIGPMEGDTWHAYRLVTYSDGRPPFMMEPISGAHDLAAFDLAGFATIGRYKSTLVSLGEVADDAPDPPGLTIAPWDGRNPEALFRQVHALSSTAFAANPFYRPIGVADFLAMYLPLVPMMKPDFVLFARDDTGGLAGFLFGIPDYAQGPSPTTAILKTYASLQRGAGRALSRRFHANARASGHSQVIHALMHDDNPSADRSDLDGAAVFRRYALMGRRIDG